MTRRKPTSANTSVAFSECEQLELFVARASDLENSRLLRNDFNPSFSIRWDRVQGLRFESTEPDEEDLRSFLLTLRQFISNDEPIYLFKVYNLCHQHITSDELKGYLIEARQAWSQQLKQGGIRLIVNGQEISPEYITNLWINGYYFHNDPVKMRTLRSLLPHERTLIRQVFLDHMAEATRQVLYVAFIIRVASKESLLAI
jgi:hypothetical protein